MEMGATRFLLLVVVVAGVVLGPHLQVVGTDSWAVLVCSSRYWFNYRHLTNTLSMYRLIKQLGVADDHIILMNALDSPCNSRNSRPGTQFSSPVLDDAANLFGPDVQVDYRGDDVNAVSFLKVLTGRHHAETPVSSRLQSGPNSSVLIFLSGHGGDEFFKFHDTEELFASDLARAIREMEIKQRYGQLLLILDTCQAATIGSLIVSPRVTTISSSARGENSYAYQSSPELGVPLIDRFTYAVSLFLQQNVMSNGLNQPVPLQRLINSLDPRFLHSTPILDQSQDSENPHNLDLREFLSRGSIADSGIGLKVVSEPVDTDGIESYDIFMAKRSREAEALVEPS